MDIVLVVPLGLDELVPKGVNFGLMEVGIGLGLIVGLEELTAEPLILLLHFDHSGDILVDELFLRPDFLLYLPDDGLVVLGHGFGHQLDLGFQAHDLLPVLFPDFLHFLLRAFSVGLIPVDPLHQPLDLCLQLALGLLTLLQ